MKKKLLPLFAATLMLCSCGNDSTGNQSVKYKYSFGSWYEMENGSVSWDIDRDNKRLVYEFKFNEDYYKAHTDVEHRVEFNYQLVIGDKLMKTAGKPDYIKVYDSNERTIYSLPYKFSNDTKIYVSYADAGKSAMSRYDEDSDFGVRYDSTHIWENLTQD
jgi:hypothetical protein